MIMVRVRFVTDVSEQPENLTEAEAIGVLVTGALKRREQQAEQARRIAVALEGELAEARRLLKALTDAFPASSWASANLAKDEADQFLATDPTTVDQITPAEGPQEA